MSEEVQILELARTLVRDKAVEFDKVLLALSAVGPFGGLKTFEEYLVTGRYCSAAELSHAKQALWAGSTMTADAVGGDKKDGGGQAVYEPGDARYELLERIGRGGMGVIHVAQDKEIGRKVAMKSLRPDAAKSPIKRERFFLEARVTGRLEHPNIVPVYDIGRAADGSAFFAMRLVRGRTLRDAMKDRDRPPEDSDDRRPWGLMRLLIVFNQVCHALAYAHSRHVIHRDLKPENIMLGDYGEVLVMDWGLAKVLDKPDKPGKPAGGPRTIDTLDSLRNPGGGGKTRPGSVLGSVRFMAPEQARGMIDEVDARSDVYALGAMLYEMLTRQPPYDGVSVRDILSKVREGRLIPPRMRAPELDIPEPLEQIVLKAMSFEKKERHAHAGALSDALEEWIDGARDREAARRRAGERIAAAREATQRYFKEFRRANELREEARRRSAEVPPHGPVESKIALWDLEDRQRAADEARIMAFGESVKLYHTALDDDPANRDARVGLAELYWGRFVEAESRGDVDNMLYFRGRVEEHDDGRFAERMQGDGTLTIRVEPSGAHVRLERYFERNRVLRVMEDRDLGDGPVETLRLVMGRYCIEVNAPGLAAVRSPLLLGRLEDAEVSIRMRREEEIPPGFVHVPGGFFLTGGDHFTGTTGPAQERHVNDFAIATVPVTCGEYVEFLRAIDGDSPQEAYGRAPRIAKGERALWRKDVEGRWVIPEVDEHGEPWHPDQPVLGVSWEDAVAYAKWRSEREGFAYRLPTEDEWEKAARGTDGRDFPWGDRFDPSFCKMRDSREGRPRPEPVGTFEIDCSPYGVRDMAGGQREWCDGWYNEEHSARPIRGGSYTSSERSCRATYRRALRDDGADLRVGFRLVCDV